MAKRQVSRINCLLGIDKPQGMTSHDVVARVRRALGERRVGHAGTLDPMATGVMVVGIGQATRLLGLLTLDTKAYVAEISFGAETNTDDLEGTVTREAAVPAEVPAAYLVHHDQKIPIRQTPFLVGKYNTSIQLHYSIYDNNKVSRNHATILQENGRYFVRDNQSRNGTSVNGKAILPLQPAPLQDGDEIKLYDEVLVFHLGEV